MTPPFVIDVEKSRFTQSETKKTNKRTNDLERDNIYEEEQNSKDRHPAGKTGSHKTFDAAFFNEVDNVFSLSYKQRIIGLIACIIFGAVLAGLGYVCAMTHHYKGFIILYSLANLTLLVATCFIMGPINQIKFMARPTRIITSVVFVGSIILTITFAWKRKYVAAIVFMLIQIIAFIWYCLSYFPYVRGAILKITGIGALFK